MDQDSPNGGPRFTGGADESVSTSRRSFLAARIAKRSLLAELRAGQEGNRPTQPEDLLARWPTDPRQDADVASILFEHYQQRRRRGDEPSREEYKNRFPEHKDSLTDLFRHQDFLHSVGSANAYSAPPLALRVGGEELFGFRLCYELGSGAFARVFLAEQADLASRMVVLKVSNAEGHEPQTLAQMQHTHIVPIYSVHEN